MFGIDAIIILVAFILGIFLVWGFTNLLSGSYEPYSGPIFLSIPLIGNLSCDPAQAQDHPAYPFGVPGQSELGCLVSMFRGVGLVIGAVIATFYLASFALLRVSPTVSEKLEKYTGLGHVQMGRGFSSSIIVLVLIVLWPYINDNAANAVTWGAYKIAAFPHERSGQYVTPEQHEKNAEATIVFAFHLLTDSSVGNHECFPAVDTDGDGLKDSWKQPSWDCVRNHLFSPDFGNTVLALIMGGTTKGILTITVYTSSMVRLIVTGTVGAFMPLLLAFGIFPIVGRSIMPLSKAYILMLICPLLIAGAYTIGDELIIRELNYLHTLHPQDTVGEKNVAFIFALAVPMSVLAMITFCMSFLAGPTLMIGGMAMMGISKVWEGAMKLGSAMVGGAVGGTTGENIQSSIGHAMTITNTGSGGGSFSIGGSGDAGNVQRVEPTNKTTTSDDTPAPVAPSSDNDKGDSGGSGAGDRSGGS